MIKYVSLVIYLIICFGTMYIILDLCTYFIFPNKTILHFSKRHQQYCQIDFTIQDFSSGSSI